jgi:hypothetical protein
MQPKAVTTQPRPTPCAVVHIFSKYILLKDGAKILCLLPNDQGSVGHYIGIAIVLLTFWEKNKAGSSDNPTKPQTLLAHFYVLAYTNY